LAWWRRFGQLPLCLAPLRRCNPSQCGSRRKHSVRRCARSSRVGPRPPACAVRLAAQRRAPGGPSAPQGGSLHTGAALARIVSIGVSSCAHVPCLRALARAQARPALAAKDSIAMPEQRMHNARMLAAVTLAADAPLPRAGSRACWRCAAKRASGKNSLARTTWFHVRALPARITSRKVALKCAASVSESTIGAYINQDPIGVMGGLNKYAYVDSRPTNAIDPLGFLTAVLGAEAGGTIGSAILPGPGTVIGAAIGFVAVGLGTWALAKALSPISSSAVTDKAGGKVSAIAQDMPPPGNCSNDEQSKLQSEVNNLCKQTGATMSCRGLDTSYDRFIIAEANRQCALARDKINKKCFAGGDETHRNQAIDAWKRYAECLQ